MPCSICQARSALKQYANYPVCSRCFQSLQNSEQKLAELVSRNLGIGKQKVLQQVTDAQRKMLLKKLANNELSWLRPADRDSTDYGNNLNLEPLTQLIGLQEIKSEIGKLSLRLLGLKRAVKAGVKPNSPTLNMAFIGNPGTGKTEVARVAAKILHKLGYVEKEKLLEVDRTHLIGAYVGETTEKTKSIIEKGKKGVIFVDEAYSLAGDYNKGIKGDFGAECIDILVKAMDDLRDSTVFIFAGYPYEMENFLDGNPGLRSRIPYTLHFPDYTPSELCEIANFILSKQNYIVEDNAYFQEQIASFIKKGNRNNARAIRNLTDRIINEQLIRIGSIPNDAPIASNVIIDGDIQSAIRPFVYDRDKHAEARQEAMFKLNQLIGLENEKKNILSLLKFFEVNAKRGRSNGSLHMALLGNPGTGKTTLAHIIGGFLKGAGILKSGHVLQVSCEEMRQSPEEIIKKAMNGILFIDEAYGLALSERVLNVVVEKMEKHKDELVVIMAGYTDPMENLMDINIGLRSRIRFIWKIKDYSLSELQEIAVKMLEQEDFIVTEKAKSELDHLLQQIWKQSGNRIAGNARTVRNIVHDVMIRQATRVHNETSSECLNTILSSDIRLEAGNMIGNNYMILKN